MNSPAEKWQYKFLYFIIAVLLPHLANAQCDCPPIEMSYSFDCHHYIEPFNEGDPITMYLSFSGGCAEELGGNYIDYESLMEISPEDSFAINFYIDYNDDDFYTLLDNHHACEVSIPLPNITPDYFYQKQWSCLFDFYDCETGNLPGVPDYVSIPDNIGESDTIEHISLSWIDEFGCQVYQGYVAACNVTDCSEATLQFQTDSFEYDPATGIETATYIIGGTASIALASDYEDFYCYFAESFGIASTIIVDNDTVEANMPVSGFSGQNSISISSHVDEDVEVTIVDQLTGCVHTVVQSSCHCNTNEVSVEQVCESESGMAQVTYHFSYGCAEGLHATSIELDYGGSTYILQDSLSLSHESGEQVFFEEIRYYKQGVNYCSRSLDMGEIYCPPVSNETIEPAALSLGFHGQQIHLMNMNPEYRYQVQVYDINGRLVFAESCQGNGAAIDLSRIGEGIYYVRAQSAEEQEIRSINILLKD